MFVAAANPARRVDCVSFAALCTVRRRSGGIMTIARSSEAKFNMRATKTIVVERGWNYYRPSAEAIS